MFNIGVFPYFSLALTLLFFPPDWPRRVFNWPRKTGVDGTAEPPPAAVGGGARAAIVAFLSVWFAIQIALPLRHYLYPGYASWTEEGHRFAWHMKLRDKDGDVRFLLTRKADGESWQVDPSHRLTDRQYAKMSTRPYMTQQYAYHLAREAREQGLGEVEVRAIGRASLNGREAQPLIDPDVDLASQPRTFWRRKEWILPMRTDE